jgi:hypothetical protein
MSVPWSYNSWIYNYMCNRYLSTLTLSIWIRLRQSVLDTTLCDKVYQWLATGLLFSPGTPVSSTNKTDRNDLAEILLKVVLNTISLILNYFHNIPKPYREERTCRRFPHDALTFKDNRTMIMFYVNNWKLDNFYSLKQKIIIVCSNCIWE